MGFENHFEGLSNTRAFRINLTMVQNESKSIDWVIFLRIFEVVETLISHLGSFCLIKGSSECNERPIRRQLTYFRASIDFING